MLKKMHLVVDVVELKCCFSSTMKLKNVFVLGASLVAIFISSCSGPGPMGEAPASQSGPTGGLRSGDYAVTRNSIDAILSNPSSPKTENIDAI